MTNFWDTRYDQEEYVYGKEPNQFFKAALDELDLSGKILLPGEGEGRNAVHAAKKGLLVTAFDTSIMAQEKALQLANEEDVKINYEVGNVDDLDLLNNSFDAVALIYAHFLLGDVRLGKKFTDLLKSGGYLILEGFSVNHLSCQEENPNVGGPSSTEVLYSINKINEFFPELEVLQLKEEEIDLEEGNHHSGKGSVIRFIGRKK